MVCVVVCSGVHDGVVVWCDEGVMRVRVWMSVGCAGG